MSSTCQSCRFRAGCRVVMPAELADKDAGGCPLAAGLAAEDTVARAPSFGRADEVRTDFPLLL